jgi:general secretion pathway protein I
MPPRSRRTPLPCTPRARRDGLTLLEVLVSLAIFLMALVGIGRLIALGNERALDVQQNNEALQRCQSKIAEVAIGSLALRSDSGGYDDQQNWSWSLECNPASVPNLWTVRATVKCQRQNGDTVQVTLSQMILDPSARGSIAQPSTDSSSDSSSSSGTTGSASK